MELVNRDADLDVHLQARCADQRSKPRPGDVVEYLPASPSCPSEEAWRSTSLYLVYGGIELFCVSHVDVYGTVADVLLPTDARIRLL